MFERTFAVISVLSVLICLPSFLSAGEDEGTRSVVFVEKAMSLFSDTSAPSFIAAGDVNSDGNIDLLVNGWRLYLNSGPPGYSFTLSTSKFGSTTSGARIGVWGDLNSDGYLDLFQGCNKGTNDRIWTNTGPPLYELVDSSALFGAWSNMEMTTGASWGDMDKDGDLDLYVETGEDWNDGNPVYHDDFMLRNDLPTGLTDVSVQAGIRPAGEKFYTRGSTWGDFNNDGWNDIYVSHYRIRENYLFTNQRDGTFIEEGRTRNCSGLYDTHKYYDATAGNVYGQSWWGPTYGHTIGSSWMDLNRDGDLDLFTSDFVHKYVGYIGSWYDIRGYVCDDGKIYISEGAPDFHFVDHRTGSGIPVWPIGGSGVYRGDQTFSGVTIGDYDSDGWEDIYIPQVYGDLSYTTPHLYRNKGWSLAPSRTDGTMFEDVTSSLGIKGSDTYANLFLDHDNDGDLDLITGGGDTWDGSKWTNYRLRLYENQGAGPNHWLEVKLEGQGKNRDAVGARVVLRFEENGKEQLLVREVRAGTGHAHQQPFTLHFGLGSVSSIDMMEVWWPDGTVQEITGPRTDGLLILEQTSDEPPQSSSVSVSDPSPIEDSTVKLTVSSPDDVTSYRWDVDSDNIWDAKTTSGSLDVVYTTGGTKFARCRLVGYNGMCRDVYPIVTEVRNLPPVISLSETSIDMDETLYLDPSTFSDTPSDLRNLTWSVAWGDGCYSNGTGPSPPSHTYGEPGPFVLEIVLSDGEAEVRKSTTVSVKNIAPWGHVTHEGDAGTAFDEDRPIRFDAVWSDTVSDSGPKVFNWDPGDGSGRAGWSEEGTVWFSYRKAGTYNVSVLVKDVFGGIGELNGEVTVLNVPPSLIPVHGEIGAIEGKEDEPVVLDDLLKGTDTRTDRTSLRYRWDLGDGNSTSYGATTDASHIYSRSGRYVATCEVIDDDGDIGYYPVNVTIGNIPPVLILEATVQDLLEDEIWICEPMALDTISDRSSLLFECDLGDGRVLRGGTSFEISYPSSGTYDVTLSVIDDDGSKDLETFSLRVNNKLPTGRIFLGQTSAMEDEVIHISSSEVSDTPSDIPFLNVSFDLGDGSSRVHATEFHHVYTTSGNFRVRMFVSDGDATAVFEEKVHISNPRPVPVLSVSKTRLNVSEVLYLSSSGSHDNPSDEPTLLFEWDLGDGTKLVGREANHSYEKPGTYTVRLTVTDDDMMSEIAESELIVEKMETEGDDDDDEGTSYLFVLATMVIVSVLLMLVLAVLVVLIKRKDARVQSLVTNPIPDRYRMVQGQYPTLPQYIPGGQPPDQVRSPPPIPPLSVTNLK